MAGSGNAWLRVGILVARIQVRQAIFPYRINQTLRLKDYIRQDADHKDTGSDGIWFGKMLDGSCKL